MKGLGVITKGQIGWIERPDPLCGPDDAIVTPIALTPCSSDVHSAFEMEGDHLKGRILGHEAVGRIAEVGSAVKDFHVGDEVVIPCTTPTWRHPDIEDGLAQHAGGYCHGINFSTYDDGTFADTIKVRSADMNLALLPEGVAPEVALMLTDMATTGFHGAELGEVRFGDTVAVLGIGPVGLMAVAGARLMGAGRLIAVGTRPACIEVARDFGATDIVSYKEGDIAEQILALTGGRGTDVTIVAGGDLDTFYAGIAMTKNGGTIANLNVFTEIDSFDIPVAAAGAFLGHKTIKGGLCPGGRRRMERLLAMVVAGRIDPARLVTHRFEGLESIERAFLLMADKPRDLIKPVVLVG
jgi:threonine dehydrogenase-like Zn-dependent dehydrogenase